MTESCALSRAAADTSALEAMRQIGRVLRRGRSLSRFASGEPVSLDLLRLHGVPVDALTAVGLADVVGDSAQLQVRIERWGSALVVVAPNDGHGAYAGADSLWLATEAMRWGLPGDRVLDIGAGGGAALALLAPRFPRAIASDISLAGLAVARLTAAVDGRFRIATVVSDLASTVPDRSIDSVIANPPWVPAALADLDVAGRSGGVHGIELPLRFLAEITRVLAPSGRSVLLTIDPTISGGARPLVDAVRKLQCVGYEVEVRPTRANVLFADAIRRLVEGSPSISDMRHVVVRLAAPARRSVTFTADGLDLVPADVLPATAAPPRHRHRPDPAVVEGPAPYTSYSAPTPSKRRRS